MFEVIDRYQPDLLYSDGPLPFGDHGYDDGLAVVAHLYNTSAALHGGVNQAIYNQKDRNPEVYRVGVLDIERSQEPDVKPDPWQTDTSVGDWFYNVRDVYKTPSHVIEILIDIVAKNGNLLLNIPQRPDGTVDDECRYLLGRAREVDERLRRRNLRDPSLPCRRRGPQQRAHRGFRRGRRRVDQ